MLALSGRVCAQLRAVLIEVDEQEIIVVVGYRRGIDQVHYMPEVSSYCIRKTLVAARITALQANNDGKS